jgi:hypothetical protein
MKKIFLLLGLISLCANAQFRSHLTREQYAENVDNYKPGHQVSVLVGNPNTIELGYSYTDILTWGASFESVKRDNVNNSNPFYAGYVSIGGEFERVTITVKGGASRLQQQGANEQTIHFVYGGSFEYRVIPNLGVVVGSDRACDCLLLGVNIHFGNK